ncbi:hypothetical protein [Bradyrhizobium sp. SHOUNA76]|uniref:hypothetical protein n=1 Tax=Bradyrhizobium sp. SHOUNA76 TaxID=2908927 RepID=UPI001FF40BC9|nr:hypothetical protein [Bradyrhizobium sp. SHOUNA76]MCJ9700864.1 hypothetical protein [Bradyrhizobium sp. SHOUNA76]
MSGALNGALPLLTPRALDRQRLARLHIRNDLVDLGAVQRAPDPQYDGQHHHDITIWHQLIVRGGITVRDEGLDCYLAFAEQQGQLARLPEIIDWRLRNAVAQQHCFGSPAGHQLDALAIDICKHVTNGAAILAHIGHHRSKRLPYIRRIAATFGERLHMVSVQRRGRPLQHRLDKLPQALHSFAAPLLQLTGIFRQVRTKLFPVNVFTASKQTPRIGGERKIAMAAQLGVGIV